MKKQFTGISVLAAGLAVVVGLGGEVAIAEGGPTGTWPDAFPLPTAPGTVISQTSTTAVVRSTDQVAVVLSKLDNLYVTENGCTLRLAVNRPKRTTSATTQRRGPMRSTSPLPPSTPARRTPLGRKPTVPPSRVNHQRGWPSQTSNRRSC
jgi:hypothetical protein